MTHLRHRACKFAVVHKGFLLKRCGRLRPSLEGEHMRRREFIAGLLLAATAQSSAAERPAKARRLAILSPGLPIPSLIAHPAQRALFGQLHRLGYVEGTSLIVARYSAEGRFERFLELIREAIQWNPDVI